MRYFFKNNLDKTPQKVLELGSNNGNNLSLFASYGYEAIGVELDATSIKNANFNFKNIYKFKNYSFINADMRDFARSTKGIKADILLIPNVINYITKHDFTELLSNLRQNQAMGGGSRLFLRARSTKDHRYGLGKMIEDNTFLLDSDEFSGENGLICACYSQSELVEILKQKLNLRNFTLITSENLNVKNGVYIKDSDIIIYGEIN
ncbi:class I SAM-dependent methyltransferase [Campylobacter mucosalis]|uniref:class I SAM-dependent methyltransferase n=1 Tax=Campylobacter mucosalis TaxID=202 RepID=UPI0005586B6F|nr:class I SAM-dependent methyltransferase [Campylobacter mucosalis]